MLTATGLWAYVLATTWLSASEDVHVIRYLGLWFYKGPAWPFVYQQVLTVSGFGAVHVAMMLASKHSNLLRTLCGFESVHGDLSFPMTVLTGMYYTVVTQSTLGYGDLAPKGPLSIFATCLHVTTNYALSGQFVYTVYFVRDAATL